MNSVPSDDLSPLSKDNRPKGSATLKLLGAFLFDLADWRPAFGPVGFVHEHERSFGVESVEDFTLTSLAAKV